MINHASRNNAFPLEQLAVASGRGLLASTYPMGRTGSATKRQKKHEMLLTFMANAKTKNEKPRPAPVKPKLQLLRTLLSFFI